MKKLKKYTLTSLISDIIIAVIILSVFVIGFSYKSVVPISGNVDKRAIYKGNTENKNVSIMINVYENSNVVEQMIELLNKYNVKATFFVGGCWADDNEQTLAMMKKSGHEIGNHGYFHKDHKKLDYQGNLDEISLTDKMIWSLCEIKMNLFAPPSGSFSDKTLDCASDLGYKVIMWSKDTIDWRDNDLSVIFKRATKNLSNGDLVLMHPKEHTLKILPSIIEYYHSQGFSIVTVGQNII